MIDCLVVGLEPNFLHCQTMKGMIMLGIIIRLILESEAPPERRPAS